MVAVQGSSTFPAVSDLAKRHIQNADRFISFPLQRPFYCSGKLSCLVCSLPLDLGTPVIPLVRGAWIPTKNLLDEEGL